LNTDLPLKPLNIHHTHEYQKPKYQDTLNQSAWECLVLQLTGTNNYGLAIAILFQSVCLSFLYNHELCVSCFLTFL